MSSPLLFRLVRTNLVLPVAQTLRIDVVLEVGAATESVTVADVSPLLKTESGELSHNVATNTMNNLPVLGIGGSASTAGIRNPYAVLQLLPGSDWRPDTSIRLNGNPSNTEAMRIEGQDATNGLIPRNPKPSPVSMPSRSLPSRPVTTPRNTVRSAAASSVTMKSGTNQYHGSAYEYFVNEFLNAGVPFTNDGHGDLLRPRQRRNDFGGAIGGPVSIPKIFNGRDKLFFSVTSSTAKPSSPITSPSLCPRPPIAPATSAKP